MPEQTIGDQKNRWFILPVILFGILVGCILSIQFLIPRSAAAWLMPAYFLAFACYLWLIFKADSLKKISLFLYGAIIIRVLLLPSLPNLSDDYFRFIWDGLLINHGINPFVATPAALIKSGVENIPYLTETLFNKLNSPEYFTIYPPVCQFIFALATYVFPDNHLGSVIIMRLFFVAAEAGSIYCLLQLFKIHQIDRKYILLYALNPLVILELTGSLHFEGLMIFLLMASILAFYRNKLVLSAIFFALAVSTKLLPLILLPLFFRRLTIKQRISYYSIVGAGTLVLFLPFLTQEFLNGIQNSLSLYFQKFEFNASIYYIIREIGFMVKGYNIIATAGKWLAVITFVSIITFSFFEKNKRLPVAFMWVWCIYLLFATTVHPWYITPAIAFACFSKYYRFMILWSLLIFLTYIGYHFQPYQQNMFIVSIEYLGVAGMLIFELVKKPGGQIEPLN